MRKRNKTDDHKHSTPGTHFVSRGKMLHTGFLEHYSAIFFNDPIMKFKPIWF
jgi:hypothetical protein